MSIKKSTDTIMWSELPREHSCKARQNCGEAVRNRSSKRRCLPGLQGKQGGQSIWLSNWEIQNLDAIEIGGIRMEKLLDMISSEAAKH